jgi:Phosphotransferase enzyme family
MRNVSSGTHVGAINGRHVGGVLVDDAVLPAAAHLTGPHARRLLEAAVDAAGGELGPTRSCHVQYRPGHDVVMRFDSQVRWAGAAPVAETLLAATTVSGPPPGTLPVEAKNPDGGTLSVGVWRWPFDPAVTGLADAVTPSKATAFLDGLASSRVSLDVVSYRPTLRAVVRAVDDAGSVFYVKAIRPAEVDALVDRHERLLHAGVPVPVMLRHDAERGLIAMSALSGTTIRDRIRSGHPHLPDAAEYENLYTALAGVQLPSARPVDGRAATALRHAEMLSSVLPREGSRLARLAEVLTPAADRALARSGPTIHGDLYEAQLVTGRGRGRTATITGVLDLDDAGPGDPLDDRATILAHLTSRAIDSRSETRRRVTGYVRALRRSFAAQVDPVELDLVTAGALVGLATGPFRTLQRRWPHEAHRRLAIAERLATRPGEKSLRISS